MSNPAIQTPFPLPPAPPLVALQRLEGTGDDTSTKPVIATTKGIFAGGRGGGAISGGLKSRPKPLKFTELKLDEEAMLAQWSTAAMDRMRMLDSMRKPTPQPDECSLLNISDRRLDIHSLADIWNLCGGSVGGRFSNTEFHLARSYSKNLSEIWENINAAFERLDKTQRKVVLSRDYSIPHEHEAETLAQLRAELTQTVAVPIANPQTTLDVQTTEAGSLSTQAGEAAMHAALISYHQFADAYVRCVRSVQTLARNKQFELSNASFKADEQAPDDESRGRPMPEWLQILIDLWESRGVPVVAWHLEHTCKPPVPASAIKLKANTIGKFSAYLSGMMAKENQDINPDAKLGIESALWHLLQASNDTHLVVSADMTLDDVMEYIQRNLSNSSINSAIETAIVPSNIPSMDRKYWSQRFWDFLSHLSELKSRPKDEKGITQFELHEVPPMPLPPPSVAEVNEQAARKAVINGGPWVNAACISKE